MPTLEELETELAELNAAISAALKVGQSYTIGSGSASRTISSVDYKSMIARRNEVRSEIAALNGSLSCRIGAAF